MLCRRTCVVVGGAKGKGCSVVERYAAENYKIAFMDVDKESGCRLKQKLEAAYGRKVFFFHGDASSEEDLELFAGAVIGQYRKVDCLFYNDNIKGENIKISQLLKDNIKRGGIMKGISDPSVE